MPQLREDQAAIFVSVPATGPNLLDNKVWTTLDGGDVEAQDTKTRPGGMQPEQSLGGPRSRSDATTTRQYTNDVLHPQLVTLEKKVGNVSMAISYTPLDADGNPAGKTVTMTGILKHVGRPKTDANNSAAAFLTLIMSCNADAVES